MGKNLRKLEGRLAELARMYVDRLAERAGECDFVRNVRMLFRRANGEKTRPLQRYIPIATAGHDTSVRLLPAGCRLCSGTRGR